MSSPTFIPAEHFKALFEAAPGSFLILGADERFTILGASDAYLQDTMACREALVGKGVFDAFPDNPATPQAHATRNLRESLMRVVRTTSLDVMPIQRYDIRDPATGGFTERYWSPVNAPVLSPEGKLLYIIHRVHNVTEYVALRRESERRQQHNEALQAEKTRMEVEVIEAAHALRLKNNELLEANLALNHNMELIAQQARHKDEFLAMLAHELRNPLAGISAALELLELKTKADPGLEGARAVCRRQLANLTRLVDDLLDVSRISRGAVALLRQPVDLYDVLEHALHAVRADIERRGHTVTSRLAAGPFTLLGDGTRLEQVMTNLLSNAAKYTPDGGLLSVVLERCEYEGKAWAELQIADNGRGIPPAKLPRIFDMFVQLDTGIDRAQGGLGVGLTLVKKLVEMHGGSVQAESAGVNQGSCFTVRLPLAGQTAGDIPEPHAGPARAQHKLHVLLVDDNDDAREMFQYLLEACGHVVDTARDGPEGLARLISHPPDVAILDIGLPGMNGFDLAQRVREALQQRTPRLIALSGYSGEEFEAQSTAAGFDLHLVKPVDVQRLQQVLSTIQPSAAAPGPAHTARRGDTPA